MTLEITGKNIDITPAIRERFEFKFNKLEKLQVPLIKKHIMISKEPSKLFKIEASVSIAGGQLVASAEHEDLFGAITELYQKLDRQLKKQAHKPNSRRASHSEKPVQAEDTTEYDDEVEFDEA
ncbi:MULTISPECIES: ribosome hibernation-promoting factor, HPF/YfiA family [Photobacterium]|uniref:Ribosome-associated translation inhibitor RaiA n=2 Tax=Photobacterium TaxID=657 RepID=A0A2T3HTF1_9GAMM|nr:MULTISPECIES: ribosome-associated translation inhibitor RaiA [Photobacterium]MCP4957410.1 ribosome-associated translation inhibitor RaiA [Photobacterium aquimaris]OBU24527.1 ribosomal subunit interface protein [Photobacterium aquimaris]PQJ41880.1 ribosomal subunit interface protein [Photobacterium aquimaris]PST98242.1 ribosome-associated translation inhibitor RaiA [Photobacterium aquimaris]SMY39010.1 Ribosome-associated inhibitor A [Photobacterium malacitanum]